MSEFISELEKILPAQELPFKTTPSFGKYGLLMPEESIKHPAKFNTDLVEFLVLNYTKPDETILDPMAGTGCLGVIAAIHKRNAIQVEIEPRFFNWMEEARKKVEKHPSLMFKGQITNILGDARELSKLLNQVDAAITSPPYEASYLGGGDEEKRRKRLLEKGYDPDKYLGGRARNTILKHYNEVDAVITSPPYESVVSNNKEGPLAGGDEERFGRWKKGTAKKQSYTQHEEPCKIDAVITSPPYGPAETRDRNPVQSGYPEDMMKRSYTQSKHMSEKNLCKLELGKIDAVITSPPYDSALEGTTRHTRGGIVSRDKKCASSGFFTGYSPNKQNIGNLKSSEEEYEALRKGLMKGKKPTYLSEMLCVYREIWKVLKPGGLAIIVVRPFIRRKKVIDLPYYTYLLMSKVGFKLVELLKLYLYRGSFWRVLYHKKYPEVPRIAYEYVLVCKKEV